MSAVHDPEVEALIDGTQLPAVLETAPTKVQALGGYDAAARFDRDTLSWVPPLRSADLDLLPGKDLMDRRVRDLSRNDAYVAAGAELNKDNIVGDAFLLNAKPSWRVLGLDEVWATEFQIEVEEKFTLASESMNNWFDASRMNTLTEMVRLAVGVHTMTGEVLSTAEWLRDVGRPFNTAIQMIDLDRLTNPEGQMDSPTLRRGVAKNQRGAPIGYWIQVAHPTDYTAYGDVWTWKYVPARKPWGRLQVIHIFEQSRPDQSRGVSAMVAALKEMKITKKFRDITLQNAVVGAIYAATIESELPSEAVFASLGGGQVSVGDAVADYGSAYLQEVLKYVGKSNNLQLDGVKIPHLFPGTKLQLRPAGTPGGVGTDFEKSLLRYVAANLGVSYEQLSRDYSESNYSSVRAAMVETWKTMQSRKRFVADRYATSIYMLWLEEMINKKQISSMPRRAPSFYEGLNGEAYCNCTWIGASRGQIDELKETQAAVLRLKYGLSTQEAEVSRLGLDWRQVNAQLEREQKDRQARGLITEQDNSINAASGAPRSTGGNDTPEDGSEDNTNV